MGRREDFAEFVQADATRLLRVAYLLTGNREAAEDLLQETLERVYVAWPRVDNPFAYTRRALARRSANRWRDRARRPEAPLDLATEMHVAREDGAEQRAQRDELVRALAKLGARQRAAVVLRYLEDLSEAETAAALGCSVGNVKSQTSRALARLRVVIDAPAPDPPSRTAAPYPQESTTMTTRRRPA
jgi:RNA polymerase sigma-70 factor (sigma-E family)